MARKKNFATRTPEQIFLESVFDGVNGIKFIRYNPKAQMSLFRSAQDATRVMLGIDSHFIKMEFDGELEKYHQFVEALDKKYGEHTRMGSIVYWMNPLAKKIEIAPVSTTQTHKSIDDVVFKIEPVVEKANIEQLRPDVTVKPVAPTHIEPSKDVRELTITPKEKSEIEKVPQLKRLYGEVAKSLPRVAASSRNNAYASRVLKTTKLVTKTLSVTSSNVPIFTFEKNLENYLCYALGPQTEFDVFAFDSSKLGLSLKHKLTSKRHFFGVGLQGKCLYHTIPEEGLIHPLPRDYVAGIAQRVEATKVDFLDSSKAQVWYVSGLTTKFPQLLR